MISKRQLRGVLDRSALISGVTHWCEARMRRGYTVLMYHRVLPDAGALRYQFRSLAMPESAFRSQARWLSEHATVLPLHECMESSRSGLAVDRPLVAITFDDGYRDNATIAAPILEEFGLRATFFCTSEFLRTGEPLWFDRIGEAYRSYTPRELESAAAELFGVTDESFSDMASWMDFAKNRGSNERAALLAHLSPSEVCNVDPMTLDELRTLHHNGHAIGAHTLTHPILPQCDDQTLSRELTESKQQLETWLNADVSGLAYPNGDCDSRVVEAARVAGYSHACTTRAGMNSIDTDPMLVARLDVTRDRVYDSKGRFDAIAFRSELCRVRRFMRAG